MLIKTKLYREQAEEFFSGMIKENDLSNVDPHAISNCINKLKLMMTNTSFHYILEIWIHRYCGSMYMIKVCGGAR